MQKTWSLDIRLSSILLIYEIVNLKRIRLIFKNLITLEFLLLYLIFQSVYANASRDANKIASRNITYKEIYLNTSFVYG